MTIVIRTRAGATLTAAAVRAAIHGVVGLARLYTSVLLGGHTVDATIVGIAAAVLIALSVLASYLPVRRVVRQPLREVLQSP